MDEKEMQDGYTALKAELAKELPQMPPIEAGSQIDNDLFLVFRGWLPVDVALAKFERVGLADFGKDTQEIIQLLLELVAKRGAACLEQFVELN